MTIHITAANTGYLFLYAAQDLGIFQKYGYQADLVVMAPPAALAALQAGEIDFSGAIGSATRAKLSGSLPVRVVLVSNDRPDHQFVGAKGLTSLQDLRGKVVVAYAPQDTVNVMMVEILQQNGLGPNDYTLVNAGSDDGRTAALLAGEGAATLIGGSGALPLIHQGFPVLARASDYIQIPLAGLAVSDAVLQDRRADVQQAIQPVAEALSVIRTQKQLVLPVMSKEFNVSPEDASSLYDGLVPGVTMNGRPSDAAVQFEFKNDQEVLGITDPINPDQIYDFSLLPT